jgi:hypothetical protein
VENVTLNVVLINGRMRIWDVNVSAGRRRGRHWLSATKTKGRTGCRENPRRTTELEHPERPGAQRG